MSNLEDTTQVTMSNLEDTSQVAPKITSSNVEKLKDPKRVEQGKKLARISKASKEKKAREKFESEAAADRALAMENSWNVDYGFIVGTVGIVTAAGALYFAYGQDRATKGTVPCDQAQVTKDVPKTGDRAHAMDQSQRLEMFD